MIVTINEENKRKEDGTGLFWHTNLSALCLIVSRDELNYGNGIILHKEPESDVYNERSFPCLTKYFEKWSPEYLIPFKGSVTLTTN